jgi:hypothetical protein
MAPGRALSAAWSPTAHGCRLGAASASASKHTNSRSIVYRDQTVEYNPADCIDLN